MKALILSLLCIIVFNGTAYSQDAKPSVPADIRLIERVIEDEDWIIIDCRDKKAYGEGHIMRAITMGDTCAKVFTGPDAKIKPVDAIEKILGENGISDEKNIIVYADAANIASAITAIWALGRVGHERVQLFGGGIEAWSGAGIPLIKAPTILEPTTYKSPVKR